MMQLSVRRSGQQPEKAAVLCERSFEFFMTTKEFQERSDLRIFLSYFNPIRSCLCWIWSAPLPLR